MNRETKQTNKQMAFYLSVPRQISKTKQGRREILLPLEEIGLAEQEYDVRFCIGSAEYNFGSVQA